jgi:hypothetical protein
MPADDNVIGFPTAADRFRKLSLEEKLERLLDMSLAEMDELLIELVAELGPRGRAALVRLLLARRERGRSAGLS